LDFFTNSRSFEPPFALDFYGCKLSPEVQNWS
jgi:hypothetical protein